jgi:predicted secreted protein
VTLPLPIPTAIAIYITIWWMTLFAILPLGVKSQHEEADDRPPGADPGAPVAPRLLWKAGVTTAVSAVLFVALMAYIAWQD